MAELNTDQLSQLDSNIRAMLENGASQEDVVAYSNDYRQKYSVKKKDDTTNGTVKPLTSSNTESVLKSPKPSSVVDKIINFQIPGVQNNTFKPLTEQQKIVGKNALGQGTPIIPEKKAQTPEISAKKSAILKAVTGKDINYEQISLISNPNNTNYTEILASQKEVPKSDNTVTTNPALKEEQRQKQVEQTEFIKDREFKVNNPQANIRILETKDPVLLKDVADKASDFDEIRVAESFNTDSPISKRFSKPSNDVPYKPFTDYLEVSELSTANPMELYETAEKEADREKQLQYFKDRGKDNILNEFNNEQTAINYKQNLLKKKQETALNNLKQKYGEDINNVEIPQDDKDFIDIVAAQNGLRENYNQSKDLLKSEKYSEVNKMIQERANRQVEIDKDAKEDTWYKFTDEANKIQNVVMNTVYGLVNDIASLPRFVNGIAGGDKFNWTDRVADATQRFTDAGMAYFNTPTNLQRENVQDYAEVDGYKVFLDKKGNVQSIRDKDNFMVNDEAIKKQISQKYDTNKDKIKVKTDWVDGEQILNQSSKIIGDMLVMVAEGGGIGAGIKGAGKLSKSSRLLNLAENAKLTTSLAVISQMQNEMMNDAIDKGMSKTDAAKYAAISSAGVAAISLINPMEAQFLKNLKNIKSLASEEVASFVNGSTTLADLTKKTIKTIVDNSSKEIVEEQFTEPVVQNIVNDSYKSHVADGQELQNTEVLGRENLAQSVLTATTTFLPSITESLKNTNSNSIKMNILENPENWMAVIDKKKELGIIEDAVYSAEVSAMQKAKKKYDTLKSEVKQGDRTKLAGLIGDKIAIESKLSDAPELKPKYEKQLSEIETKISNLTNGISDIEAPIEQATDVNLQVDEFDDGKAVIDKITEKPIIEEPKDLAVEKPAAEMDNAQLDEIFETKIANPDAELDNIFSALPLKNKVDESQITPNELVNTGQEQDVSKGLSGEYQNNKGLQQELGEGQVSGTEVPTEKVEEKIDNVEIKKLQEEIDSFDDEYNRLVDAVNKEDRKLNTPKSENEIKLNQLQDKINALIDKRNKLQEQQTPIQQSGEAGSGGVGGDMVEPKKQNYTQFAKENGYPDDYDTSFQAQLLGSRGLEGKRQSTRSIKEQDVAFQEMQKKKAEGKKAYEQAILDGKVIDPDSKLTREGILKRDYDFNKKELESKIANAENGVKNIEGLGKMAHLDNGKLKKGYQRAVDDYNETIAKHKESLDKLKTEYEQSLKETTKSETPTTNTGVEEGSGVGGDVEAKINKVADEYLYHGTGEGAFRRIREEGLTPQGEKYLYFADKEQYAKTYAQRKGNSFGDRVLRVKKSDAYLPDENTTGGDFKIKNKINPNDIEIKHNGKWIPIQEFADENIGIMPISKAVEQSLKETPKTETTENPIQIQAEEKLLAELVDDIEKGKNPNTTTTPKEKEQNSQSNFTADLSDANNSVESKISAIDGNIKKHGVIDNGSKSLIKSAIEKVDGLSVNNIFDIASRIAKFDKSEIRIEQIAEAIQYEAGRVENEKDVFSISLDDIQETLLSKYKQETPANKERMNDIGIADKTYTDRSDKLKSIKKTYELLSAESKALASQFIKRYYDTIKDDAKFTADEYLDLIDNIIKGKKIEDIAENIQNAIRVIEDKEAIELNKLPPIKEPLKDAENTTEALRRLTSNELNKIPLYSKQSVEKMIDESLQKNNEVRINIPFGSLYGLPDKVMTVVLNKDNTIVFFDKNGKETKGIKFDRENFNDFAFDVAKDQYKSQDSISKAYHKAKADGSNPELVKAVEDLLSKKDEKIDTEQRNVELINISKETAAEISPNKNVSASKASAIKDLLADKYSDLKEMEAGVLANLDGTESIDDLMEYVDWNRTTQKGGVYKGKGLKGSNIVKLIEKGYVEELSFIDDNITLTDKGKKFQEALKARIETRKGIKDGTDLFPKDAGLKGKELVGDALDRIVDKIGGKKNLTEQEKTTLTKDITDLAKGLLQEGKATIDNIIDKIIDAIKERLPNLDEKDVKDLADTIKAKVATNRAIEILKEKGLTFEQAKAEFDKRNILYNEDDIKDAWDGDKKEKPKTENKPKGEVVEKTVLNQRVFKGEVSDELRRELKKHDLNRTTIPYHEARQIANDIIENVGLNTAFEAVERGDITGSPAAEIYNAKLEDLEKQINKETDADVLQDLIIEQARIFSELSDANTKGGQFSSQMRYIYENSDIGYNVEKKISEWKEQFGEISPEVEQKFRDLDAQIKELNKQIAEAEQKAVEAEQKAILESIKASSGRKAKSTKVYGKDRVARGVDNLASLMGVKLSATGLNRPSLVKALTDIGFGLIEEGIATTENVAEKVKEYVKSKFGDKINVDDFADDINNAINLNTTQGKVKVPHSLIEKIVSEMDFSKPAIENFKLLVETVMEELGSKFPDATERDFRDAITNYGKIVNLNADEIAQQIRKLKRIGKIESALEDIRNKKRPLRSGQQRDKLDAEERAKLKELREAMKELPMDEETLERELKTQLDAEKTRVRNQIEDLQREIDKNELTPRNARTVREDAELKELKEKRDKLKEEHDAKFKDDDYKEKKRLELAKKTAEKKIEDLQRRIREGDFSKAVRKPLVVDTELVKLKAQKLEAQEQYDKEFYKNKLKNRTKGELVKDSLWELWGITRALRATGEFSFVGVQGLINTIAHPMQSAKAFKNALTFFGSEKKTEDWLRKLKSQPYYPDLKASKLAITEPHAELNAREELFYSGWTNIIWNSIGTPLMLNKKAYEVWKNSNPFKAVERASVGYLDTIRVARYLDGVEMLKEKGITFNDNPQAYKEMADVINTFTGRGSIKFEALGGKQESSELLSKIFFSPKNWSSMIKTATPYALYHFGKKRAGAEAWKPSVAQKMALADFSKFVGFTTTILAMAAVHFNNDDDDEIEVELDPRSSDFGKIRIGKKYIDPWGGRIQQVILISKLISQSVKTKDDEVLPLGIPYKTPTHENLLIRMALNKLSPSAQILDEYLSTTMKMNKETGEYERNIALERGGGKYEFKDEMLKSLYPIYWGTVADLYKDDPSALNGVLAFYAFFGGGVNVYNDKKDKETKKRSGLIQNH